MPEWLQHGPRFKSDNLCQDNAPSSSYPFNCGCQTQPYTRYSKTIKTKIVARHTLENYDG